MMRFLLYSNFFIGLATSLLVYSENQKIDIAHDFIFYLHIFFDTVFIYALHRWISQHINNVDETHPRQKTLTSNLNKFQVATVVSLFFAFVSYWWLEFFQKWALFLPGIIALLYVLPVFNQGKRLRDFNYIKVFLIAISWALVVCIVPLNIKFILEHQLFVAFNFIGIALYIFSITLPFDIRDIEIDRARNAHTFAQSISISKIKRTSYISLVLSFFSFLYLYSTGLLAIGYIYGIIVTYLITAFIISTIHRQSKDLIYTLYLDGTMIVFALVSLLAGYLTVSFVP